MVIVFILYCLAMLILSLRLNYSEKHISELKIHQRNYMTCNEYQSEMTTYVIENYDDILNYSKKVLADFDKLTYTDQFGRTVMDKDTYAALLNEYNFLNGLYDIHFYEDKLCFVYNTFDFENLGNEYYGYFYFVFENDKIEICPYTYTCYEYT